MKGNILRKLRQEKGLTQLELSTQLGVCRSLIGMVETGKQDGGIDFSRKVANYFNVSLDYLEGKETVKNEDLLKDIENLKKIVSVQQEEIKYLAQYNDLLIDLLTMKGE